jgi:hypothetical protein
MLPFLERVTSHRNIGLVVAGCLLLSSRVVAAQEEAIIVFPKDKPVIEAQFPEGFKTAFRKDGTCLAVGSKTVMALVAWEKTKNAATAKNALPEFAKTFLLGSLSFREASVQGVAEANLPRSFDGQEPVAAKVLTGTGKNSDGDEMSISVTAFPWAHRYFVLFAVCSSSNKERLAKDRDFVLSSVTDINDD